MAAMILTTADGLSIQLLTFQGEDNFFLFKLPQPVEETLETEGVDGRRWRTKFSQMTPATLETIADATSWAAAVASAQEHMSCKGTLVGLSQVSGGTTYLYKDVHVSDVKARPIAGQLTGAGASSSSTNHVRTTWILEPTDFKVFAN